MTDSNDTGNSCLKLFFLGLCIVSVWLDASTHSLIPLADYPVENDDGIDRSYPENRENDTGRINHNSPTPEKTIKNYEIDWSDSIFERKGFDNDPIVIESHKLMFFTVPKNACTTFKKLFRRMMGFSDWMTKNPHDPDDNGLKYLGNYSREEQLTMMTSPDWTKAIFVRDPLERTLSAYLDKGLRTDRWSVRGAYVKRFCCGMEGQNARASPISKSCGEFPLSPYLNPMNSSNFPYETFVDIFMKDCNDPHWQHQSKRLGSATNWKFINFVGKFESQMEDTHSLLKQIGAFQEFGKSGWERSGNKSLAIFETNIAGHKTGSAEKMNKFYTPSLLKRAFQYYQADYELFNLTIPFNIDTGQ